jgi:hypothetical protein
MAFLKPLFQTRVSCGSRTWLMMSVLLLPSRFESFAQTPSAEYQVKAVYLFNFAQFVEWPAKAFPDPQRPLVIGVLGDDPFGNYLDETIRGESVNKRALTVQRFRRVGEVKTCHVLFISRSESDRLEQTFSSLKGRHILTVGDTDDFTQRGGMIRFVIEKSKIRVRINLGAVKAADLAISSKLLRVAEIEP